MQRFKQYSGAAFGVVLLLQSTQLLSAQTATPNGAGSTPVVAASSPAFPDGIWELSHENDWFIYSDRDYTGGLRLAYTTPNYRNWAAVPLVPEALGDFFNRYSLIDDKSAVVAGGIYSQINMYTPNNLKTNPPNPYDHPYAGWVGLGLDLIRQTAERRAIFETNLGWIGPDSGGEDLQEGFHSVIQSTSPQGWDHQIKNEPVLQLTYRQDWRPAALTNILMANPTVGYDLIGHGLITVGNGWDYTAAGALVRFGYHLPKDFGPARLRFGEIASMPYEENGSTAVADGWSLDSLSVYFCVGAEGRAVARDITLDGNTFAQSASVNKEPLVAETYAGLVTSYGHFRGSFLILYETNTFHDQPQPGQWRGLLTLGVAY